MDLRSRTPYLIPWLFDFGLFLVVFTVGRELAENGEPMFYMGLVGSMLSVGIVCSCIIAGRLADRFGRRRVILAGSVLATVCPLLAILRLYFLTYAVLGVAAGVVYPALVAHLTDGKQSGAARNGMSRVLILFCVSWNLGLMSGQLFGGALFEVGRAWPLWAAFAMLVATVGVVMTLRSGRGRASDAPIEALAHRERAASFARLAWVANIGGAFSMSMVVHLLPTLAVHLGIPPDMHGAILAVMRCVVICVYLALHFTSFWHFRFVTAVSVQVVAAMALLLLATTTSVVGLCIALAGVAQMMGYNYFAGLYYSAAGSGSRQRGAASGMHVATLALGFVFGSALGGLIGQHSGVRAPYFLASAVVVAILFVQVALYTSQPWSRHRAAVAES